MAETARRHIVASSTGGILAIKLLHGLGLVENVEECEGQMSEAKKSTEPFGAAIASIGTIEYMKPDWDHHRGIVPSPAVRQAAVEFLRKIARDYGSDIPEPTMVAPTSEGFVALEWRLRTPAE